jgi:hypothetical protein
MFENMAGAVGFAMHEDRLAKAAKNMRLVAIEQGRRHRSSEETHAEYRAAIATALVTLAIWIAPSLTRSDTATRMMAR